MIDYHLHTRLCKHASGEVSEFIEHALNSGISEIAFTDHIPLPDNFDIEHRMTYNQMDIYQNWITHARTRFPDINIKFESKQIITKDLKIIWTNFYQLLNSML